MKSGSYGEFVTFFVYLCLYINMNYKYVEYHENQHVCRVVANNFITDVDATGFGKK